MVLEMDQEMTNSIAQQTSNYERWKETRAGHTGNVSLAIFTILSCIILSTCLFLLLHANCAYSAEGIKIDIGNDAIVGGFSSKIIQIIGLLTILSIAPSILIMVTSFTKIAVVLSLLRSAIGLQQTPPNAILTSLALFLTFFIMAPTFKVAYEDAVLPLLDKEIVEEEAVVKAIRPFHKFMLENVLDKELSLFVSIAKMHDIKKENLPLHVLIPAFMLSELKRAFEIGFLVFLPFLIIDILISSILMGMGMIMLPPVMISLPFKIIFFVLIDGWYMICGSLVKSYGIT